MAGFILSRSFLGAFLLAIFLVHAWATVESAYFFIWWLDIVMHFSGGLWIGLAVMYFTNSSSYSDLVVFLLALGLAAAIGIFWEFMEFGLNRMSVNWLNSSFYQPSLEDTLADLLADMLGGILAFTIIKKIK